MTGLHEKLALAVGERIDDRYDVPLEVGSGAFWFGFDKFWFAVTVARSSLRRTMTALWRCGSVWRYMRVLERQFASTQEAMRRQRT